MPRLLNNNDRWDKCLPPSGVVKSVVKCRFKLLLAIEGNLSIEKGVHPPTWRIDYSGRILQGHFRISERAKNTLTGASLPIANRQSLRSSGSRSNTCIYWLVTFTAIKAIINCDPQRCDLKLMFPVTLFRSVRNRNAHILNRFRYFVS